ncbi:tRNA pseudouridine synthase A [Bacillus manliponensis]|uniref:tRNA pseudouridine synthase A n=1 Tax=Bacillus manliponensis TaxID=574376 RepID=A0A073JU21_9BACI|nr:tRNA pseudouridine synthase A [Bacillus manliponensis]
MERIKCTVAYDGMGFCGFQIQPQHRTVQQEIEKALQKLHKGEQVRIQASGRTDSTVHAKGQVIHFDTPLSLDERQWGNALNTLLPDDVIIVQVEKKTEDFHARYGVVKKEYRYRVHVSKIADVFRRNYAYQYGYPLDIQLVQKAIPYLIGTHDFTSFCSAKTDKKDKVRTIYEIELIEQGDEIIFRFVGNGFLYNMVRILVGTLLSVGQGKIDPDSIPEILQKMDRRFAGKMVPGHGLYLWEVNYNN